MKLVNALRSCGHLDNYEDRNARNDEQLARNALMSQCENCRARALKARLDFLDKMRAKAEKWLIEHNIDPKDASIDPQSNEDLPVCITLWIKL